MCHDKDRGFVHLRDFLKALKHNNKHGGQDSGVAESSENDSDCAMSQSVRGQKRSFFNCDTDSDCAAGIVPKRQKLNISSSDDQSAESDKDDYLLHNHKIRRKYSNSTSDIEIFQHDKKFCDLNKDETCKTEEKTEEPGQEIEDQTEMQVSQNNIDAYPNSPSLFDEEEKQCFTEEESEANTHVENDPFATEGDNDDAEEMFIAIPCGRRDSDENEASVSNQHDFDDENETSVSNHHDFYDETEKRVNNSKEISDKTFDDKSEHDYGSEAADFGPENEQQFSNQTILKMKSNSEYKHENRNESNSLEIVSDSENGNDNADVNRGLITEISSESEAEADNGEKITHLDNYENGIVDDIIEVIEGNTADTHEKGFGDTKTEEKTKNDKIISKTNDCEKGEKYEKTVVVVEGFDHDHDKADSDRKGAVPNCELPVSLESESSNLIQTGRDTPPVMSSLESVTVLSDSEEHIVVDLSDNNVRNSEPLPKESVADNQRESETDTIQRKESICTFTSLDEEPLPKASITKQTADKQSESGKDTIQRKGLIHTLTSSDEEDSDYAKKAKRFRQRSNKKYVRSVGKKNKSGEVQGQKECDTHQHFHQKKSSEKCKFSKKVNNKPGTEVMHSTDLGSSSKPKCKKKSPKISPKKSPIIIMTDSESGSDVEGFKQKVRNREDSKLKEKFKLMDDPMILVEKIALQCEPADLHVTVDTEIKSVESNSEVKTECSDSGTNLKCSIDTESKPREERKRATLTTLEYFGKKNEWKEGEALKNGPESGKSDSDFKMISVSVKETNSSQNADKEVLIDVGKNDSYMKEQHSGDTKDKHVAQPSTSMNTEAGPDTEDNTLKKKGSSKQIRKLEALLEVTLMFHQTRTQYNNINFP